jgi:hypothetical protein
MDGVGIMMLKKSCIAYRRGVAILDTRIIGITIYQMLKNLPIAKSNAVSKCGGFCQGPRMQGVPYFLVTAPPALSVLIAFKVAFTSQGICT